MKTEMRYII